MITVPEAAQRTGRNAETIRRWIRAGRLRSQKIGTQHFVDEADIDSLIDADAPIELPDAWTLRTDGRIMPAWEQLVRDGRRSH